MILVVTLWLIFIFESWVDRLVLRFLFIFSIFLTLMTQICCGATRQIQIWHLVDKVRALWTVAFLHLFLTIVCILIATLLDNEMLLNFILIIRIILFNEMVLCRIQHENVVTHVSIETAVLKYIWIQIKNSLLILRWTFLALVRITSVFQTFLVLIPWTTYARINK